MGKYLDPNNALYRLREDWEKHNGIIVAVDFDSTLVPYMDDEKGYGNNFEKVRQLVRDLKTAGCTIIIFTASAEDRWTNIKEQLFNMQIEWDLFNESPEHIPNIGKHGKVYANAYLDDRAGLYEVYCHLQQLLLEHNLRIAQHEANKFHNMLGDIAKQMQP